MVLGGERSGPRMTTSRPVDVAHIAYGGFGGQASVVRDVAARMRAAGLRSGVVAYAPVDQLLGGEDAWPGLDEVRPVVKRRRIDRAGSRRIGAALRDLRPRAVLWHSAYAPSAVLRSRVAGPTRAVLLVEHSSIGVRDAGEELRSIGGLLVSDAVVMLTRAYDEAYRLTPLVRALRRPVRIVPNGVDGRVFFPVERPDRRTIRLGMAARLVPSRDLHTLLASMAVLAEAAPEIEPVLVIAGDGPLRDELGRVAASLGVADRVEFAGRLSEPALAELLRGLDIYVQASRGEGMSTSVLQAWASGLPVIASDVPGLREMLRPGVDGVLVPPGDPPAMAEAIATLARDRSARSELGRSGRDRAAREYSLDAMAAGYLRVLSARDPGGPWSRALAHLEGS